MFMCRQAVVDDGIKTNNMIDRPLKGSFLFFSVGFTITINADLDMSPAILQIRLRFDIYDIDLVSLFT